MKRKDPSVTACEKLIEGAVLSVKKVRLLVLKDERTAAEAIKKLLCGAANPSLRELNANVINSAASLFAVRAAQMEAGLDGLVSNVDVTCSTYGGSRRRYIMRRAVRVKEAAAVVKSDLRRVQAGFAVARAAVASF